MHAQHSSRVSANGPAAAVREINARSKSLYALCVCVRTSLLQVDPKQETVLLPIYGVMVPFHITTIKAVTHAQDGSA